MARVALTKLQRGNRRGARNFISIGYNKQITCRYNGQASTVGCKLQWVVRLAVNYTTGRRAESPASVDADTAHTVVAATRQHQQIMFPYFQFARTYVRLHTPQSLRKPPTPLRTFPSPSRCRVRQEHDVLNFRQESGKSIPIFPKMHGFLVSGVSER